ncbi:MAG: NADH-quinone oxidoreductase subunit J [Polyangiaceae bacterium]|jgi:NADH-quinone oxidoreductase subunit J|nr:NADH-quinone oxidoreductase subunit J [Polyangiaceae bacterium]
MTALEQGLFYVSAAVAIAGALGTVASRSPIRSAMSLLLTIMGIAGLYVTLSAQLLAAIQVMVYAGAVVVLFVFVIMLLGGQGQLGQDTRSLGTRVVGAALFATASLVTVILIARAGLGGPHIFDPARIELGSVDALGRVMFTDGVVAFELVGVLLTAAIVGVMAIARSRRPPAAAQGASQELQKEANP